MIYKKELPPQPSKDAKTFDEWIKLGRCVNRGQKAIGYRDRKAVFTKDQTRELVRRSGCFDPMEYDERNGFPCDYDLATEDFNGD